MESMESKIVFYAKIRYAKNSDQYSIGIPKHIKKKIDFPPDTILRVEIERVE